jgi:hypothetical protein
MTPDNGNVKCEIAKGHRLRRISCTGSAIPPQSHLPLAQALQRWACWLGAVVTERSSVLGRPRLQASIRDPFFDTRT